VTFFCDNKDDNLLIPLIQQYVPWSTIEKIAFSAIQHRFSSIIECFIHNNNLGKCETESFQQMELDKETFADKSKTITYSCSSGDYFVILQYKKIKQTIFLDIVIRPLLVSDASIINDLWVYKTPMTLAQIIYEIEHFPAFGN